MSGKLDHQAATNGSRPYEKPALVKAGALAKLSGTAPAPSDE